MPVWNDKTKRYDEELPFAPGADAATEREERFRTALLNELDGIAHAIRQIETDTKGASK